MKTHYVGGVKFLKSAVLVLSSVLYFNTGCAQNQNSPATNPAPVVTAPAPVIAPPASPAPQPAPAAPPTSIAPTNATAPAESTAKIEIPEDLSPGLAEIIKLTQAHVGEEVILAYINSSRMRYAPSADEIVYLSDLGVSEKVISALLQHGKAMTDAANQEQATTNAVPETNAAPATAAPAPTGEAPAPSYSVSGAQAAVGTPATTVVTAPTQPVTVNYFYESLSPYGVWVDIDGYGRCWRPSVAMINPGWQPYWDRGHWVYTDCGWYWNSDYSWGWAAFHYGRWHHHNYYGWVWYPDTCWGPSWVCWRQYDTYCGWAPLPPAARYEVGVGFTFNHGHVGVDFGFGLGVGAFRFVHYDHFCDPHPWHYAVPHDRVSVIYSQSTVINNYYVNNSRTVINEGVGRDRVATITRKPVERVTLRDLPSHSRLGSGARVDHLDQASRTLTVYRPDLSRASATTGATPTARKPVLVNSGVTPALRSTPAATQTSSSRLRGTEVHSRTQASASPLTTPRSKPDAIDRTPSHVQPRNVNPQSAQSGNAATNPSRVRPTTAPTRISPSTSWPGSNISQSHGSEALRRPTVESVPRSSQPAWSSAPTHTPTAPTAPQAPASSPAQETEARKPSGYNGSASRVPSESSVRPSYSAPARSYSEPSTSYRAAETPSVSRSSRPESFSGHSGSFGSSPRLEKGNR